MYVQIVPIREDNIEAHRVFLQNSVQEALKRTLQEFTPDYIIGQVLANQMQAYVITVNNGYVAFVVTRVNKYPTGVRELQIVTLTTYSENIWQTLIEVLQDVMKHHETDFVSVIGRKGWEKVLKEFGFNLQYVVMTARTDTLGVNRHAKDLH